MSHFKIMGGDLPKTTALITVFGALQLSAPRPGFTLRTDTYDLKNNIALIEQITEDNKNKVLSKAGFSKLPMRQLTPTLSVLIDAFFSKLPMRQLTSR